MPDGRELDVRLTGESATAKVRELLSRFRAGMFVTRASDGGIHVRPLGLQDDGSAFDGTLWFFVDDRSRKVRDLADNAQASVMCQSDESGCYLHLRGRATVVRDRAKMQALYSMRLRTWFPGGVDDPHMTLVRFDAADGEFWDSPGGVLQAVGAFTKALVTGAPGRSGRAGAIDLSDPSSPDSHATDRR